MDMEYSLNVNNESATASFKVGGRIYKEIWIEDKEGEYSTTGPSILTQLESLDIDIDSDIYEILIDQDPGEILAAFRG